jgi:hypothetical protein
MGSGRVLLSLLLAHPPEWPLLLFLKKDKELFFSNQFAIFPVLVAAERLYIVLI